jgi:hypothetical protein
MQEDVKDRTRQERLMIGDTNVVGCNDNCILDKILFLAEADWPAHKAQLMRRQTLGWFGHLSTQVYK